MVALGVEGFTILAVLEARDRMSAIFENADRTIESFSTTIKTAAENAQVSADAIDSSILETASGTDAFALSNAKLEASLASLKIATAGQATAQQALMDAQAAAAAAADGDADAQAKLVLSLKGVTDANKAAAIATKAVKDAEVEQATVMAALATEARNMAEAQGVAITSQEDLDAASADSAAALNKVHGALLLGTAAVAALGYESVKSAGNFQDATVHLVTDAGETQASLAKTQAGILQLSAQTGTSANDMVNAMYHIDSAGYHVANGGLQVLKVAAEGAKVGGADLDTVSRVLVGTMTALGEGAGSAASVMNQLIATVGAGDMRMDDLTGAISTVMPVAAAAHISLAEVGGALSTMTAQGMTASQAAQDLANTIRSLSNPTKTMIDQMQAMGLNSNQVSMELGKQNGLASVVQTLFETIASHTKDGQVFINTLKSSQTAAADANEMLKQLPASIQKTAQAMLNGQVTAAQWTTATKGLSVQQQTMAREFESLVKKSSQFNQQLTSGTPAAQTINAALAKLTGNSTAMNTALLIGAGHLSTLQQNINTVADAAKKGGSDVDNWSTIQGTFNQKMEVLKSSVEAAGISIGTVLLPTISRIGGDLAGWASKVSAFVTTHQELVKVIFAAVAAIGALLIAAKSIMIAQAAWNLVTNATEVAMGALDAVMDANPIVLVTLAVLAIVAALIYAYTHFKVFRDVVKDVFDYFKTITIDQLHAVEDAWKVTIKAAEALFDALKATFEGIAHAAEAVWHAIVKVWNEIWSVTSSIWNGIINFFKKWWPLLLVIFLPMVALVVSIWNHFHQDIMDVVHTVWDAITDFFKAIWDGIVTLAKIYFQYLHDTIVVPIEAIWSFIKTVWTAVKPFLEAIWTDIKDTAEQLWNDIYNDILAPITRAWHDVVTMVDNIKDAVKAGLTDAWNDVKNIGSDFLQIGKDIIDGIVNGIKSAAGSVGDALKNAAGGALHMAKSFLGIGSPSRVFRDEIGQWIPKGVADGINSNLSVVQAAAKKIGASALTGAQTNLSSSFTGLTAGLAGSGATGVAGINLTVDLRGAQVMSDRDMNQLVDKVGRAVATRILPQGGVRIRS